MLASVAFNYAPLSTLGRGLRRQYVTAGASWGCGRSVTAQRQRDVTRNAQKRLSLQRRKRPCAEKENSGRFETPQDDPTLNYHRTGRPSCLGLAAATSSRTAREVTHAQTEVLITKIFVKFLITILGDITRETDPHVLPGSLHRNLSTPLQLKPTG
ncbi:hypothetical protein C0Q70_13735 [Pomacea canaliculata]|uniref:Uncharacterized protein n=1 Tax=Pomacea canaliculata TaxID=400727 RepID=A0A2T7NY11_POMCA|nr:hypothetical protein C0Q70_13735 [Pomacea canaliculata]